MLRSYLHGCLYRLPATTTRSMVMHLADFPRRVRNVSACCFSGNCGCQVSPQVSSLSAPMSSSSGTATARTGLPVPPRILSGKAMNLSMMGQINHFR